MSLLIIDDEKILLKALKVFFESRGLHVQTETDAIEAIARFRDHNFQIVLVDVIMPNLDGAEVIRRIKSVNPLCNCIVMTAYSSMSHVIECIEAGAVDYIMKPFTDMEFLYSIVKVTLERTGRWSRSFGVIPEKE
jgi:CheY-like chemotaxis protein